MRMTDSELFFSFVFFTVYTSFRNRVLSGIHREIHGMVPLLQINMLPFYRLPK